MKIIIKESNRHRIQEELDKEQKRCRERTVNYEDIVRELEILNKLKITKKGLKGTIVDVDINAQYYFLKAYRYAPRSTKITLIYTTNWALTNVWRGPCERYTFDRYRIFYSEQAKKEIIEKAEKLETVY